jgi:hypothetical protein
MRKCVGQHTLELLLDIHIAKVVKFTYFSDSNCQKLITQIFHCNLNKVKVLKVAVENLGL